MICARRESGISLLELVLVIVVVGIAAPGMLLLIHQTTKASADPQMIQQANAIARSYLEEALARPFCDPDGFATPDACPAACLTNACGVCGGDGAPRGLLDDVCDYAGINDTNGAVDQTGSAIPGLGEYNVSVAVDDDATLNGLAGAAGQVLLVNVNVTHDGNDRVNVTLSGYRVNF